MQEEKALLEQAIESIDTVLGKLQAMPWVFRLDRNKKLTTDENIIIRRDEVLSGEEAVKQAEYIHGMWEKYGEFFLQRPFTLSRWGRMQKLEWLDIAGMTWAEIKDSFLLEELPLLHAILRSGGYWHEPVTEKITEEELTGLIAFRYKEWMLYEMLTMKETEENHEKE